MPRRDRGVPSVLVPEMSPAGRRTQGVSGLWPGENPGLTFGLCPPVRILSLTPWVQGRVLPDVTHRRLLSLNVSIGQGSLLSGYVYGQRPNMGRTALGLGNGPPAAAEERLGRNTLRP